MAVVGSTLDLSLARGKRRWDSELILAYHHNLVPRQIKPDYGDVWSARLHTGLVGERFSAGGGVYVDFSKASKISYMHLGTTLGFSF